VKKNFPKNKILLLFYLTYQTAFVDTKIMYVLVKYVPPVNKKLTT